MVGPIRSTPTAHRAERQRSPNPPRPPNSFILYRSHKLAEIRAREANSNATSRMTMAQVSQLIGGMWKTEDESVKQLFDKLAEEERVKHQQKYPDYRFAPQKKADKLRAKAEKKKTRPARVTKSKSPDAIPSSTDASATTSATPPATSLPVSAIPRPFFVPGYPLNMPQPSVLRSAEAQYGYRGPSPPIPPVPSPISCGALQSPRSNYSLPSSSSTPSIRSSTSLESTSSQSSINQFAFPSLPPSQQPSPDAYATQSLPALLFEQSSPRGLPSTLPQRQAPSPVDNVVPAAATWNNIPSQFVPQNTHNVIGPQQDVYDHSTINFQLPTAGKLDYRWHSHETFDNFGLGSLGRVDPGIGMQPSTDFNDQVFNTNHGRLENRWDLDSLMALEVVSKSLPTSSSIQEDIESLFRSSDNYEVAAHTTIGQRQPGSSIQEMMNFFNFDAAEDSSPAPSTLPTSVAPQEMFIQHAQHAAQVPVFTPMTNVGSGSSYVPPAGASNSSTRRVGGSWKPSFTDLPQTEDPVQSWPL